MPSRHYDSAHLPFFLLVGTFSVTAVFLLLVTITSHALLSNPSLQVLGTQTTTLESLVYLGSGNSYNTDWTTLPQIGVTLDPQRYPNLKSVTLEAALSIIGGEVYIRLINSTTGAIVWTTYLVHNTSTPTWKTSPVFSLTSGSNTYALQVRTSGGEIGNVHGARLRLVHE